jgi:hypothetical protein
MNYMAAGGGAAGAAAAAAAVAQAIRASGAIVKMEPKEFQKILAKSDRPAVVMAYNGWPTKRYHYLISYKGLFFYTKSPGALMLPGGAELILAEKIWIPG